MDLRKRTAGRRICHFYDETTVAIIGKADKTGITTASKRGSGEHRSPTECTPVMKSREHMDSLQSLPFDRVESASLYRILRRLCSLRRVIWKESCLPSTRRRAWSLSVKRQRQLRSELPDTVSYRWSRNPGFPLPLLLHFPWFNKY